MATELAKAYVQIVPSADGIKGQLSSAMSGEAESAGKTSGLKLTSALKGVIAAAGIGTALKSAITEGAALEQSIGGIETLFKDSADKMKEYAKEAYKTAGISANDYMEQATSFSASLLQSVGGDTEKAADAANQALIDMADNSNKMGTDLANIQNAYQGFAKQNYTMLDNLKLGYGGTKTEMERLLADAQELSGVEYDIDNLADVYDAIHVIQENLDITGTTSKEAASTLSGSLASMKASFTNLLGYWTIGEDIKPYITEFIQTACTFLFDNLLPALGNIIVQLPTGIATFIATALPMIAEQAASMITTLTTAINEKLPEVLAKGTESATNFITGLFEKMPEIMEKGGEIMSNLIEAIVTALPQILEKGGEIIKTLATAIVSNLPTIAAKAIQIVTKIASTIVQNLPTILAKGIEIVAKLAAGIIEGIPKLIAKLPQVFKAIRDYFKEVNWASIGANIIKGIANGIKNGASAIADAAKNAAKSAFQSAKNFLGIASPSKLFRSQVGEMISLGMAEGIYDGENAVDDAMKDLSRTSTASIDTSMNMPEGNYASKALTENLVNGLAGVANGQQGGTYSINLNVDGKTIANVVFDPLNQLTTQRRVALGY
jgi:phage-related protein